MKSKKLFAILTLVAFLMTLVPMAAFAGTVNQYASKVQVDKTTVEADGSTMVKFTVYLFDGSNGVATDTAVYVASNRATTDVVYDSTGTTIQTATNNIYTFNTTGGKVEFKVKSSVAGVSKYAVGLTTPDGTDPKSVYQYIIGDADATAASVQLIDTKDITFTTTALNAVSVVSVTPSPGTPVANGLDSFEVAFKVVDKSGAGIADQDVNFSVDKSGYTLNKTTAKTDAMGIAKVKIYATKNGTYTLNAAAGSKSVDQTVTFTAGSVFDVQLTSDNNQKIAKAQTSKVFKFKAFDVGGNWIKTGAAGSITAEVVTKPTDSNIATPAVGQDGDGYITLTTAASEFDKEGAYKFRAKVGNGKYADVDFTVKAQGTVTGITLAYDEKYLALGAVSGTPTVKRVDAEGIALSVSNVATDINFFANDPKLLDGVNNITTTGKVYASTNKDYTGSLTITALDKVKKLTTTATMTIGTFVQGIALTAPAATTTTGEAAAVGIKVVDRNGQAVGLGTTSAPVSTYYIISKPEGAVVTAEDGTDFVSNLQTEGAATINVTSSKAGDVVLQAVITDGASKYTSNATIKFGAPVAPVVGAAKSVTMFLGAKGFVQDGAAKVADVAPFLKDNRTFVEVRALGNAFGATVDWNATTKTVTLTRSDRTVTIVIGGAVTKTVDGVSSAVASDVPAFITAEGRTVLPFRAVGEAFGYTVGYDAATQAVSYSL